MFVSKWRCWRTNWPSLEIILPELKTVLPNAVPQCRDIEGYVDPTEPLRDEGPFGDHTGYYTLPEPYPVFHVTAIRVAHATRVSVSATRRNVCVPKCSASRQTPQASRPRYPLHRRRVRETLPAHLQDELSRDCGHRAAGGRRLPQLVFVSICKTYPMQAYKVLADGHQCTASGAWTP